MEKTSENKPDSYKNHICAGILAHVDAGKTTLSEGLLYISGTIREMGRVDKQNAYLDTDIMERERGITIFSKQAMIKLPELTITLLDTPGHVDFSAEMERTLQVLDYAILVISGADGVQGHTKTLWRLLEEYQIPVFLFINKMDQPGTAAPRLMAELKEQLSDSCISFQDTGSGEFYEEIAMCGEEALELFLETGAVEHDRICHMIAQRQLFPCYFGSALKMEGVAEFLQGFCCYTLQKAYPPEFGAKVFKIARDENGNRLTYMKITGGSLKTRTVLNGEKVNQLRLYSGIKYEAAGEVSAGEVCAAAGLTKTWPGQGLGIEQASFAPLLDPVLTYRLLLPETVDAVQMLPKLRQLEEEEPNLHVDWNEAHQEILVHVMGEVQTEILQRQIRDRFGVEIGFDTGHILYKETIANTVEGVGHFEPLRHYAEVHLILEPGERGSGLTFQLGCSEDILDKNWQRLILTHLEEKTHVGVLTGSAVTDIRITLAAGRAHQKHTEGGDFRQATYRAVRQGLKQAESILLEPYYEYRLEVPEAFLGHAMTDLQLRHGSMERPAIRDGIAVITGKAPVSVMQEYAKELAAYTRGSGRLFLSYGGYDICHNPKEVIAEIGYDAEADLANPTGSVFCAHGAGYLVDWDQVPEFMHVESVLHKKSWEHDGKAAAALQRVYEEEWIDAEEVDSILAKTFGANRRDKSLPKKGYKTSRRLTAEKAPAVSYPRRKPQEPKEEYLLVDGYNIIYASEELKDLSVTNMDGARGRLLDILCNYQGMKKCHLIAVFDAYRVEGHKTEYFDYHNIHVVYTKEAETADAYIEKFAHENARKYHVTVATSDGLERVIIRGAGCQLLSAKEFWEEISQMNRRMQEEHIKPAAGGRRYLLDDVDREALEQFIEE
ncbi:MAG: GTP-binding protein [Lachnospiraceae bacterium]|nr:GTP-binding protein [Lachnospiraceae bacterium]